MTTTPYASLRSKVTVHLDQLELLDIVATPDMQIEIQQEIGFKKRFKLYIHFKGRTIIRICRLRPENFDVTTNVAEMLLEI